MRLRRYALLLSSLLVVALLGGLAVWSERGSAREAQRVHTNDRLQEQRVLSGLTGQYLQFTFLATNTAAASTRWTLRPDDPTDRARLAAFTRGSPLTDYGAALVSLAGTPLSVWPSRDALPPLTDPGYAPLRSAMLAGHPGLSAVMSVRGLPVVAFGVPVRRGASVAGILVAFANARTWPLEGYVRRLDLGKGATPYTVDAAGTIAAAADPALVGTRAPVGPVHAALAAGRSDTVTFERAGRRMVASYSPVGLSGWGALTEQPSTDFSGMLHRRSSENVMALLLLLLFAGVLLVVFHHRRQRALQQLAEDRLYDPLTGLGQRTLFQIRLDTALSRHRRTGAPLALLYCDLDEFKSVNDRFGHNAGDQLLAVVADRLRAAVRGEDEVVRLGGDEFAVLVEGVSGVSAVRELVARIRGMVEAPVPVAGEEVSPHLSIGAAVLVDPARADELVHEADLAMYAAKTERLGHKITVLAAAGQRPDGAGGGAQEPVGAPF